MGWIIGRVFRAVDPKRHESMCVHITVVLSRPIRECDDLSFSRDMKGPVSGGSVLVTAYAKGHPNRWFLAAMTGISTLAATKTNAVSDRSIVLSL